MASRERQRAESVDNATPMVPLSRLNDARYNLAAMIQDNDFRVARLSGSAFGRARCRSGIHQILVDEAEDVVDRFDGGVGGAFGIEHLGFAEGVDGVAPELLAAVDVAQQVPAMRIAGRALHIVTQRLMRLLELSGPKKRLNLNESRLPAVHYTRPEKPMKASAMMPAVSRAMGTPLKALGTLLSSSCSRMPAKRISARP